MRRLAVALCAVVCGCGPSSSTDQVPAAYASPRPIKPNVKAPRMEVSEAEAKGFAAELEKAAKEKSLVSANQLVDGGYIAKLAFLDVDAPEAAKAAIRDPQAESPKLTYTFATLKDCGDYRLAQIKKVGNEFHPVFRSVNRNGNISYTEFRLGKNEKDRVVAIDLFDFTLGEWSQSYLVATMRSRIDLSNDQGDASPAGKEFSKSFQTMRRMAAAISSQQNMSETLAEFRSLPDSALQEKRFIAMAVTLAEAISEQEFGVEIARLEKYVKEDSVKNPLLLRYMKQQGRTDDAIGIIEKMDQQVGGDPFLDIERSMTYLAADRVEEAEAACTRLSAAFPDIYAAQAIRMRVAAASRKHDLIGDIADAQFKQFGEVYDVNLAITDEQRADFQASDAFKRYDELVKKATAKANGK
jgi:hypothetical protein